MTQYRFSGELKVILKGYLVDLIDLDGVNFDLEDPEQLQEAIEEYVLETIQTNDMFSVELSNSEIIESESYLQSIYKSLDYHYYRLNQLDYSWSDNLEEYNECKNQWNEANTFIEDLLSQLTEEQLDFYHYSRSN